MRIKSDFKDYYDGVQRFGQDQTFVYNRYPKKVDMKTPGFVSGWSDRSYWGSNRLLAVKAHTVGFCGKTYSILEVNKASNFGNDKKTRADRKFCFSVEDVASYFKKNFPKDFDEWNESSRGWGDNKRVFVQHFEMIEKQQGLKSIEEFFREHYTPIFVASDVRLEKYNWICTVTFDSVLKNLEFYRVFDSQQAYQEIAMWLGNQAVPMKPIPVPSDEIMAEIKGFDKFSFRKDPSKKKKPSKSL